MAVIGTFGSFTAARLGIYASQAALSATGNNIANINTEGYTRQRMDLVSLYSYGSIRYANSYNMNIGYGVLVDSVSQLRDPFLDIRFRDENASAGAYEAKLDCMQQLAHVLDEVGRGTDEFGIVEAQFNDFLKQLQNLNGKVGSVEYDTTVRGSAQTLTRLLNDYSKAMDTLAANKLKELKEDVNTVNTLLTEIRDLSVQIRDAGIVGDNALELRDARNVCIDKLSAYMQIDVSYDMEKIDEFNSVERINISIANSGKPPIKLIQGIYGAQISMPEYTAARNPDFNAGNPAGNYYISRESNFSDPKNPKIVYTNSPREAWTVDGKAVENTEDALKEALKAAKADGGIPEGFDISNLLTKLNNDKAFRDEAYAPYLKEDGTAGTWNADEAKQVPNAVEGDETNRLWMTVEPLVDVKGRYLRDEYHKQITESVDLTDTQLHGSLQALREFLTEKGEFSSDDDVKFDPDAAHKRGIQYYQRSLDALARKFADEFNRANQLNIEDVLAAYKQDENGAFVDAAGSPLTISVTVTDGDGNETVYNADPAFFEQLTDDLAKLEALRKQAAGKGPTTTEIQELKDTKAGLETEKGDLEDKLAGLNDTLAELEGEDPQDPEAIAATNEAIAATNEAIAAKAEEIRKLDEQIRIAELTPDEAKAELETLEPDVKERTAVAYEAMEKLRNEGQLTDLWSFYNGGVLFSCDGDSNDPTNITAGNITISKSWATGDVRILNTKVADGLDHSTADDNIYHMIDLMNYDFNYYPNEIVDDAMEKGEKRYFTGSFQERLADMDSIMAEETETTAILYNNYTYTTLSLENSRQSVSGVDLNDEATNMMVFQKSYAAACQLMTTLDSMLDKLINGTLR